MGDKSKGLFPDNNPQPIMGTTKKSPIFPKNKNADLRLFSPEIIADLEEQQAKAEKHAEAAKAALSNKPKYPLFSMYDEHDNLLFVTVSPQHQVFMRNRDWYWDVRTIKVEFFKSKMDQEEAKFMAIRSGNPEHNSHFNTEATD